jgi:hypothetical protein
MATRKTTNAATAIATGTVPASDRVVTATDNMVELDWHTMLSGKGDAATLNDSEAVRELRAAAARVGAEDASVEVARSGSSILVKMEEAFRSFEKTGVKIDRELLISATAASTLSPRSDAEKELKAEMSQVDRFIELAQAAPAATAWLEAQEKRAPGFKARAMMKRTECEALGGEFKFAAQQLANKKAEYKRAFLFGPVLDQIKPVMAQDPKVFVYGGAAGFRTMAAKLREHVAEIVKSGSKVTEQDARTWVADNAKLIKDPKKAPTGRERVEAEFAKVKTAVAAFTKFLNDNVGEGTFGVHAHDLTAWAEVRGKLAGDVDKWQDAVNLYAGKLVPAKEGETDEDKAAREAAEAQAKIDALNEADNPDNNECREGAGRKVRPFSLSATW